MRALTALMWMSGLLGTVWAQSEVAPVSTTTVVSETVMPSREVVRAVPMREGVLRVLDKQTNAVQILPVVLENAVTPAPEMQVLMRKCVQDYKGMRGLDVAWVEVELPASEGYKGWIFNWYPDAAGLEHPRYDVRLVQCGAAEVKRRLTPAAVGGVVVQGVEMRGGDEEAPDAAPTEEVGAAPVVSPVAEEAAPAEAVTAPEMVAPAAEAAPEAGGEDPFFVPGLDDQQQLRQLMDQ